MKRISVLVALLAATTLSLTACGSSDKAATSGVAIVASTNVWGNIAKTIGGDKVSVTSLISNPNQDPHEFNASTQTALAVSKAQLIIENGGGYDDFMSQLRKAHNTKAPLIDAVDVSGAEAAATAAGVELNEHIWYSMEYTSKVASDIASELGTIDPKNASVYTANEQALQAKIDGLSADLATLKTQVAGEGVAITEPVPLYMTDAAGLVNKTPAEFSEAIEEGDDVAPAVLNDELALFTGHQVKVLAYNLQTSTSTTEEVLASAKSNDVAVVGVTETLPKGKTYISWMQSNIDNFRGALVK
jgi:zinc/manganese transport system substrate-binding protein